MNTNKTFYSVRKKKRFDLKTEPQSKQQIAEYKLQQQ